jgi:hypothetical protein
MLFVKLNKLERKRFVVVTVCVLSAVLAWLFMALNKTYPYLVETTVIYTHEPQVHAFTPLQADTVDLKVTGTGWQLIFSRFRLSPPAIRVSLQQLRSQNYITLSSQLSAINAQLETTQQVISVSPDTLFFDFSERIQKKVPVRLISHFKFNHQFDITDSIRVSPRYVTLSGTKEELANTHYWLSDTLALSRINQSIDTNIKLQKSEKNTLNIEPSRIDVFVPVSEFTEKVIEVPLKVINNTNFNQVRLFPQKVKVTLRVALNRYKQISVDDLSTAVDLNQWQIEGYKKLNVKLMKIPPYSKVVFVEPRQIDYLIEK